MTLESAREELSGERPDLTGLPQEVVAYIEALETALQDVTVRERARTAERRSTRQIDDDAADFSEAPTTINVISISRNGRAKRTPRHLYGRQRRGGMGVFDLETGEGDQPAFLTLADEQSHITLVTSQGRALRVAVRDLPETPVHGRGESVFGSFRLREGEQLALVFADPADRTRDAYLAMVSARGHVRRIGHQYLGKNLQPGTVLYNVADGGEPAACCWTSGQDDLVLVTAKGMGIRFAERLAPVRGCLGMRVEPQDRIVAAAACTADDGVFLLSDEGKGTIRLMSGFSANKSPGAGGKIAMKAENVVGAVGVAAAHMESGMDMFALSKLGKIIRFSGGEVPPKEGVVQGVNCMNLRADACVALAGSILATA